MKTLKRNQSTFWYCLYAGQETVYDDYGNETGSPHILYAPPVEMRANVSPATGLSDTEQFGNLENYDKVIVTDDLDCPIDEHTVLFVDKEPEFSYGNPLYDYIVKRVAKSLNSISIAVRKVNVG